MTQQHEKINYVEFPARDMEAAKRFFSRVFGWTFTYYSDNYMAFDYQGLEGGFFKSDDAATTQGGGALIVFYSDALEQTQEKILNAGGSIVRETFSFPGGRRFHFCDPNGNEYAVWSAT